LTDGARFRRLASSFRQPHDFVTPLRRFEARTTVTFPHSQVHSTWRLPWRRPASATTVSRSNLSPMLTLLGVGSGCACWKTLLWVGRLLCRLGLGLGDRLAGLVGASGVRKLGTGRPLRRVIQGDNVVAVEDRL
jgi:hypothetical protein